MTVGDLAGVDGDSSRSVPDLSCTPRKGSVGPQRRPSRRPSSAFRERQASRPSIVQQKLHAAIQSGERASVDLIRAQSNQSSFRARGVASAAAAERGESDRSVSRYRNDAAIVSFTDPPSSSTSASLAGFCYAPNFMPGVHFYTFLASKDVSMTARVPASPGRNPIATAGEDATGYEPTKARKSTGLRMWIPDTVVYGETGRTALLYTDEDGFVQRSMEVSDKIVFDRLAVASASDLDPIVVCKEPTTMPAKKAEGNALAYHGNLLRLLSPGELKTVLSNVSSTRSTKAFALQKFVRCNGSKAFIVRAVHDAGKPPYAWMINNTTPFAAPAPTVSQVLLSLGQEAVANPSPGTLTARAGSVVVSASSSTSVTAETGPSDGAEVANEQAATTSVAIPLVNRVCTSIQIDKSCTFIKLSERGCTKVAELNQRLIKFIEHRLRLQLQTLVADYTKDTEGRWWLLQVKHFRVRSTAIPTKAYYSLPRRFRLQYLGYRDSSIVEETADSDEEHDRIRRAAEVAAQMTQRQVRKLVQCKCCLAAYPKEELSFKMTFKMINEMLVRIRSRLPPEKTYSFLTAALARESTDPSLAYESWSVCSYCYAIYERDQHLQKVESKFAEVLGAPDQQVMFAGLAKLDERAVVIDPNATSTVLPAQLTLCRLMLVINGIYDIPPELYDAEKDSVSMMTSSGSKLAGQQTLETVTSRLYLRISALGFTECIPVDPAEICISNEKAPRGTRRRRSSTASLLGGNGSDDGEDSADDLPRSPRQAGGRNYWLPIHLIRTVHFFAPRTPLHAKLKETSGLTPFLNEDNSISIQFVRATEPPLQDPTPLANVVAERGRTRRTALQPQPLGSIGANKADLPKKNYTATAAAHTILLGATKLRMAQFRSAYVTKLDFYACMALTGEMFNIKGNLGLERVRYVDTKLLTSRYRLRAYNGVYIPDESFVPSDPLTSEWMDCLRALATVPSETNFARMSESSEEANHMNGRRQSRDALGSPSKIGAPRRHITQSASTTSLSAGNEDMDEELEQMIERAVHERQHDVAVCNPVAKKSESITAPSSTAKASPQIDTATLKKQLLPFSTPTSCVDSQMAMLMNKPVLSPRVKLDRHETVNIESIPSASPAQQHALWSLNIQLNHVHNLQSRERPYCRWECYYELFGQRRSAVERSSATRPGSPQNREPEEPAEAPDDDAPVATTEVSFSCTHRFFVSAPSSRLASHLRSKSAMILSLRNDVYSSTRSRSTGEFFCKLDLSGLMGSKTFDATLDIHAASTAPQLTPREAALVSRSPPYLSVSVHLSQMALDPHEVVANGDFVVVGSTADGIQVLKKII